MLEIDPETVFDPDESDLQPLAAMPEFKAMREKMKEASAPADEANRQRLSRKRRTGKKTRSPDRLMTLFRQSELNRNNKHWGRSNHGDHGASRGKAITIAIPVFPAPPWLILCINVVCLIYFPAVTYSFKYRRSLSRLFLRYSA